MELNEKTKAKITEHFKVNGEKANIINEKLKKMIAEPMSMLIFIIEPLNRFDPRIGKDVLASTLVNIGLNLEYEYEDINDVLELVKQYYKDVEKVVNK